MLWVRCSMACRRTIKMSTRAFYLRHKTSTSTTSSLIWTKHQPQSISLLPSGELDNSINTARKRLTPPIKTDTKVINSLDLHPEALVPRMVVTMLSSRRGCDTRDSHAAHDNCQNCRLHRPFCSKSTMGPGAEQQRTREMNWRECWRGDM